MSGQPADIPQKRTRRWAAVKRALLTFGPLVAALVIEIAVFEIIAQRQNNPGFASFKMLVLILNQSAVFGIMAIGMTLIIITGGIDLSVGSLMAFAGVASAMVVRWGGEPLWAWIVAGWAVALLVGALSGAISGGLITRFGIPPFIATLALMSSVRGLGNLITRGKPISPMPEAYDWIGRHQIAGRVPVSVLVAAVLNSGLSWIGAETFGQQVILGVVILAAVLLDGLKSLR